MGKKFKIKSEKPKEKFHIFSCTEQIMDKAAQSAHFELFGNREIILEGCMGVFEYSDTYIKLKLKRGAVMLCGSCFDIVSFEGTVIDIKGIISSLEFGV